MAYETKVILAGFANFIKSRKETNLSDETLQELKKIYDYVTAMANVEGVVLDSFDSKNDK